jgi:predicted transcriptional regulator
MISNLIKTILKKLECNLTDLERYSGIEYSILWRMLNHNQDPTDWEIQQLEKVLSEKTDYKQSYIDKRLNKYKAGVYGNIKGDR